MVYDLQKKEMAPAARQELEARLPSAVLDCWQRDPVLSWLPAKGLKVLNACFDMEAELLTAGAARETAGRIGYLLRGSLELRERGGERIVMPGALFGVCRTSRGEKVKSPAELVASEDAAVVWWQFDVVESVCYNACWFHARLIQELDKLI